MAPNSLLIFLQMLVTLPLMPLQFCRCFVEQTSSVVFPHSRFKHFGSLCNCNVNFITSCLLILLSCSFEACLLEVQSLFALLVPVDIMLCQYSPVIECVCFLFNVAVMSYSSSQGQDDLRPIQGFWVDSEVHFLGPGLPTVYELSRPAGAPISEGLRGPELYEESIQEAVEMEGSLPEPRWFSSPVSSPSSRSTRHHQAPPEIRLPDQYHLGCNLFHFSLSTVVLRHIGRFSKRSLTYSHSTTKPLVRNTLAR